MAQAEHVFDAVIAAPFGRIGVVVAGESLSAIALLGRDCELRTPRGALAREACAQLRSYLRDARFRFELPLAPAATAFQARVRRGLVNIPAGRTLTYGELARRLASSARAVGGACRGNPLPVVVPCHRVVGVDGPGGFMGRVDGAELGIKRWLLEHERR